MHLDPSQSMPLEPRPARVEACSRRVEPACAKDGRSGFRPLPGSVPFDVFLEGSNRIKRETDTFSLSRAAGEVSGRQPASEPEPVRSSAKNGWARLGEVLTAWHGSKGPPPAASTSAPPQTQTTAVRHTGTGRMIDVVA